MQRISTGDTIIEPDLVKQEGLLLGQSGATVLAVDAESGKVLSETKLASPPTWDGVSAAGWAVFVSQLDESVACWKGDSATKNRMWLRRVADASSDT